MEPLSGVSVNMGGGAGIWNCVGLINYNEPLFINVQGGVVGLNHVGLINY